ncbi:hypothetical protein [Lutispora thermophila]|uniref:Uncharacterized protein n=1 Tax=Lutispora thermophila DSM 19022 TaxID=1122184 RepID=A0A1M6HDV5_9FIRM|nr:hypothetical protein [Lutispora thermophila]SHJ20361.1 hypothetical protein SAMN02745176_02764 [Lutispora thermophila DSM 19022]
MIEQLDFAEPFFSVDYVENEDEYWVEKNSIIINLAERSQTIMYIKGIPIMPLKGTIAKGVYVKNIGQALVVKDYERCDLNDIQTIQAIKRTWKSLYECSGLERHKGLPYYKSPKFKVGEGRNHIEVNFCFVSEPLAPSGLHQLHDRDFDEVHAQIRGFGMMQKFVENDPNTYFGEYIMAPGIVHDKFYDETGYYPWHQYQSITPCVYCPIEIDR